MQGIKEIQNCHKGWRSRCQGPPLDYGAQEHPAMLVSGSGRSPHTCCHTAPSPSGSVALWVSFLLLHDNFSTSPVTGNNRHLLSHSFCGLGIRARLRWSLWFSVTWSCHHGSQWSCNFSKVGIGSHRQSSQLFFIRLNDLLFTLSRQIWFPCSPSLQHSVPAFIMGLDVLLCEALYAPCATTTARNTWWTCNRNLRNEWVKGHIRT